MESEIKTFSNETEMWKHVGKNVIDEALKEFFDFDEKLPPQYRVAVLRDMISYLINRIIDRHRKLPI